MSQEKVGNDSLSFIYSFIFDLGNARNEALRILALGTSASACGEDVSRAGKTSVLLKAIPVESGSHTLAFVRVG